MIIIAIVIADIDECTSTVAGETHRCSDGSANEPGSNSAETKALCRNTEGNYSCYCLPGWQYNEATNMCEGTVVPRNKSGMVAS